MVISVPSTSSPLTLIVLCSADGNFEVTLATKTTLDYTGRVEWRPPAIYKSSCEIDVEYFPFDEQTCVMKFGSWTYDGFQVDLRHVDESNGTNVVDIGIDLTEFYTSVEWDILEVPAIRNEKFYTCCDEPYLDITFNITMRRKTLFYTVNLIIPCMGISFLTILVFYLPSDSGEKVKGRGQNLFNQSVTHPVPILPTHIAGVTQHIHSPVVDCVLLAAGRDHSADVAGRTAAGEVRPLHHDPRHVQVSDRAQLGITRDGVFV